MLENDNTDSSQRNIVYVINSEKAQTVQAVASRYVLTLNRQQADDE